MCKLYTNWKRNILSYSLTVCMRCNIEICSIHSIAIDVIESQRVLSRRYRGSCSFTREVGYDDIIITGATNMRVGYCSMILLSMQFSHAPWHVSYTASSVHGRCWPGGCPHKLYYSLISLTLIAIRLNDLTGPDTFYNT